MKIQRQKLWLEVKHLISKAIMNFEQIYFYSSCLGLVEHLSKAINKLYTVLSYLFYFK